MLIGFNSQKGVVKKYESAGYCPLRGHPRPSSVSTGCIDP
jgi:hypothetical protein